MSPSVPLSDENFARLQSYATPLVDTVDTVLKRIFDHYDATASSSSPQVEEPTKEYFVTSRGVKIPVGLQLWATYRNSTASAVVTVEGIQYDGVTYDDPSAAAKAAKRKVGASEAASSTNGWLFWMMKGANLPMGTPLDYLRSHIIRRRRE